MSMEIIDRESIVYLVHQLENFEKDKAIRSGLHDAVNVFISGGKRRLNQRLKKGKNGNLRNSFTPLVKRNKPGALAGFKRGKNGGNHAHLVDRGTKKRPNRGVMPANYFWHDTSYQDEDEAKQKLFEGIQRAVERINDRR